MKMVLSLIPVKVKAVREAWSDLKKESLASSPENLKTITKQLLDGLNCVSLFHRFDGRVCCLVYGRSGVQILGRLNPPWCSQQFTNASITI